MLHESQLSTRNMVNAVTEEFWKMVNSSVYDQALQFKSECSILDHAREQGQVHLEVVA